jgi:hypothetical protein
LKASLDAGQRLIGELRSSLAEERRRVRDPRRQIQAVQDSRSWRLLTRLGRMKSGILGSSK